MVTPRGVAHVNLLDFVKQREGRARDLRNGTCIAYWDAAGGVWTIGYGTTGWNVKPGTIWTYAQCESALESKLADARRELLSVCRGVTWPDGAQDALTDFVYNVGIGNFQHSKLHACVMAHDWDGVRRHLTDWEYAGGKKLGGLVVRREAEIAMIHDTPPASDIPPASVA